MRERSDPLVPILGSAVFVVVILAIGLFYPRVAKWFGPDQPSRANAAKRRARAGGV